MSSDGLSQPGFQTLSDGFIPSEEETVVEERIGQIAWVAIQSGDCHLEDDSHPFIKVEA